jgi:hypothetical protein
MIIPAQLAGRCLTGEQRGHGTRTHAIDVAPERIPPQRSNLVSFIKALCGAEPGRRSAGWSAWDGMVVDCPRCIKKIERAAVRRKDTDSGCMIP